MIYFLFLHQLKYDEYVKSNILIESHSRFCLSTSNRKNLLLNILDMEISNKGGGKQRLNISQFFPLQFQLF